MSGNGSRSPEARWVERAARELAIDSDRSVTDSDQTASDADQTASDADQTASDADQTASERDEADAISDQLVADLEQARAELNPPVERVPGGLASEESRRAREATRISRLMTRELRATTARARLEVGADRDATAVAHDETARRQDLRAQQVENAVTDSDAPLADKLERLRVVAAGDRARAAADRAQAATHRVVAARERAALESALHSAQVDELTGAFRRKLGMLALRQEFDRARRGDGRLVCAFIDVDDLKVVNDRDGYTAGDRVLKELVSIMRSNLRSFDPIMRFGGDAFVCALAAADLVDAARRFELIDRSLRAAVGGGICVGLAALASGETLDDVLGRADAALREAKSRRPLKPE